MPQKSKQNLILPNGTLIPKLVELIGKGHTVTLTLKGYSMRPFLESDRDKGVFGRVDTNSLRCGDVVLALLPVGMYVVHRIIEISGDNVTLLGDGNLTPEHCTRNDILAIVTGFYRRGSQKVCTVESAKWRIYSRVWMALRPVRRYLLAFHRRIVLPLSR